MISLVDNNINMKNCFFSNYDIQLLQNYLYVSYIWLERKPKKEPRNQESKERDQKELKHQESKSRHQCRFVHINMYGLLNKWINLSSLELVNHRSHPEQDCLPSPDSVPGLTCPLLLCLCCSLPCTIEGLNADDVSASLWLVGSGFSTTPNTCQEQSIASWISVETEKVGLPMSMSHTEWDFLHGTLVNCNASLLPLKNTS